MAFWGFFGSDKAEQTTATSIVEKLRQLQDVTYTLATKLTAQKIALQILVPQIAALSIGTYSRETGEREKGLLHDKLNYAICSNMTGYEFWAAVYTNLLEYQNSYCFKRLVGDRLLSLTPIPSPQVSTSESNGVVTYVYDSKTYTNSSIWHLRTNSYDGLRGSRLSTELDVFTIAKETEELVSKYMSTGGNVKRIWQYIAELSDDQRKTAEDNLLELLAQKGEDIVVPYGFTYENGMLNVKEAQLVEQRQFNKAEILQLYGIDIENIDLEKIYNITIVPLLEMVAQSIEKYLLSEKEQQKYKISYVTAGRFRGSIKDLASIASSLKKDELATTNEIRQTLLSELGFGEIDGGDKLETRIQEARK